MKQSRQVLGIGHGLLDMIVFLEILTQGRMQTNSFKFGVFMEKYPFMFQGSLSSQSVGWFLVKRPEIRLLASLDTESN